MLNGWRVIKGYDVYVHNDFIKYGISEKGPDAHTTFPYFYHKGLKQWIPCDCKGVEVHEFLSDDYTMGNYDLEYKGAYATKEMELLDLKERIFSEFYDARLLFKKLTVGQKKITGDAAHRAYGSFKALQRLIDNMDLNDEYESWKSNNGLQY